MNYKETITELINRADILISAKASYSDSDFKSWYYDCKKTLSDLFGNESIEVEEFLNIQFYIIGAPIHSNRNIEFCAESLSYSKEFLNKIKESSIKPIINDSVFLVHGHDEAFKEKVARILEKLSIPAIILSEQNNFGKTIIEKFETYAGKVKAAIILFTPDDLGRAEKEETFKMRARQNVVFEAGFFIAMLERKNVLIVVSDKSIELPSDISGVVYMDSVDELRIAKELNAMGFNVDLNKLK